MSEKDELEFDALMQQAGVVKLGDKRDMRERKEAGPEAPSRSSGGAALATEEDLAGYGFPVEGDEEAEEQ